MSASGAWHAFSAALASPYYQTTQRRVLRQMLEALLFEQVLSAEITPNSHESVCFDIIGRTQDGSSVRYRCCGYISDSFGRIRLNDSPVLRISLEGARPVASLQEFLLEAGAIVGTTDVLLTRFLREIQQTLLKDMLAQHARQPDDSERDLTMLEGQLQDGHPYHPCYKSRIGFDPIDNFAYGPEFQPSVRLGCLALLQRQDMVWLDEGRDEYRPLHSIRTLVNDSKPDASQIKLPIGIVNTSTDRILSCHNVENEPPVSDWLCTIRARDGFLRGSGLIFLREFAAQRNAVYQQSMLDRECTAVFTVKAPQGLVTDDDFLLIPSHPWQARWLLRVPVMVEAKRDGRMRHLGAQGELYYPTASVRMLYQAGNPYFYKFSLHVRLTNFGRKNAVYERENLTPEASAEQWFSRNVQQVMYPVLYCYFAHGVVFEPHLQNVIIGLVDNWPTQVCLRDFEGVKPDRERFPTTALFGILIKAGQLVFAIVQGHSHPFRVVPVACWQQPYSLPAVSQCRVTIAGQLCTPKDILASEVPVDQLRIGDLLLFPYAGAYAWHISHHDFLRHPHPQHIYLPVANQAYSS